MTLSSVTAPTYDRPVADEHQHALGALRTELGTARTALDRAERALGELERAYRSPSPARARPTRYLEVLVAVYDEGGRPGVDTERFGAIGQRHGYDRRGLGGFFTGGRAPLVRQDGRVMVTAIGRELIDGHLQVEAG